jgi:hypothetical protein
MRIVRCGVEGGAVELWFRLSSESTHQTQNYYCFLFSISNSVSLSK